MTKIADLAEQIQRKRNQAIENAKIKHITPDQLLTKAREEVAQAENSQLKDVYKSQIFSGSQPEIASIAETESVHTSPLPPLEKPPISKQLDIKKEAIGEQLISNWSAISKHSDSDKSAIDKQLVSKPESNTSPSPDPSTTTWELDGIATLVMPMENNKGKYTDKALVSDSDVIGKQKDSNKEAHRGAIDKQLVSRSDAFSKQLDCDKKANQEAFSKQLGSDLNTFQLFSPLQQQLLSFLFQETKKTRSRSTDPIDSETLAEALATTKNTVKDTIAKLKKRNAFVTAYSKRGAGGWTAFELSDAIYHALLELEKMGKFPVIGKQLVSKQSANKEAKFPSSSSDLNIYKTTTREEIESDKSTLPQEWLDLDFKCLASIGFKEVHLRQIYESGKATPDMVQESIWEMDHDLRSGGKHGLRSPLLVLLKLLRSKGEPYTAVTPGYVSDDLKYEQKRVEELKRRQAEITALRQEAERVLKQDEIEAEEREFEEWKQTKSEADLKGLARNFSLTTPAGQSMIKDAFRKEKEQIRRVIEQSLPTTK